jgi:hypothetical protein
MRLAVPLIAAALAFGCSFSFERGSDLGPGDIAGQAVSEVGAPLPFARLQIDGTSRVVLADRNGEFVVRGLPAGTWVIRASHDFNGDGLPERAGVRAAQLRESGGQTGFLVIGQVTLDVIAKATGLVRDQDGNPVEGAKVVVVRSTEVEPELFLEGGVEQLTSTDAGGAFIFPALAAGDVTFKAFLEQGPGSFLSSEPVTVSLEPGDDSDLPLATLVIDRDADTERQVQIDLLPPPVGDDVKVILTAPGALPDNADLADFNAGLVQAGGPSVSFAAVPVGIYDVHLVTSAGARGLLCGQAPATPGPLLEVWGAVELGDDACVVGAAGDRDCDADGQPGLPLDGDGPDLDIWTACAPACATGFGGAGANPTCETAEGVFDCDDDGDGQPDVTEPFLCTTRCAGHDTDGDNVCQYLDPFPQCASNDPADPACTTDQGPSFVQPPVRPEYGGPPVDVPDAGPGDAGVDAGPGDGGVVDLPDLQNNVLPHFAAAPTWGKFLQVDATGAPVDAACDEGLLSHASQCIHGAERLSVPVPELASCTGVTVRDGLDAFDWRCVEANTVELHSTGLKDGRGLQDLINFAGPAFEPNQITVDIDGVPTFETPLRTWWGNGFGFANGGLVFGDDAADTIFLVTAPVDQSTWTLDADGAALVVAPGVSLRHFDGAAGGGFGVVTLEGNRNWFEGDLDLASVGQTGIQMQVGALQTLRNVSFIIAEDQPAIVTQAATALRFTDIFIDGGRPLDVSATGGVLVERMTVVNGLGPVRFGGDNHLVRDLFVANDASGSVAGLQVDSVNSVFQNVHVANVDATALALNGSNNIFQNLAAGHAGATAVDVSGDSNLIHHAIAYGATNGFFFQGNGNSLTGSLALGNTTGLEVSAGFGHFTADFASAGGTTAISISGTSASNLFGGRLWVEGTTCSVTSTGNARGLIDGTCTDDGSPFSVSYTGESSDAELHPQISAAGIVGGELAVDDAVNPDDTNGARLFDDIQDFSSFERGLRAWGAPGVFPTSRGRCQSGQTCNIYDLNLVAGDTGDPNATGVGVAGPVAIGTYALPGDVESVFWQGFAASQAECEATHRGSIFDGKGGCDSDYIRDTVEVLGDDRGNDDGLCNTGEACIFNPNLGPYAGHGAVVLEQDPFDAAPVTNVRLLRFENLLGF